MGKISSFLLFCLFLATFWASVSCEGNDLLDYEDADNDDGDYEMLPPGIVEYLSTYTPDPNEPTTTAPPPQVGVKVSVGQQVHHADYPHQVTLYSYIRGHFCGGSIIHPFLILTAAHCFGNVAHNPPHIEVRARKSDPMQQRMDWKEVEQVWNVTRVFVHAKWNSTTFDNDIAVLVLNQSLDLNGPLKPIPLRDPAWDLPEHANVSGWGSVWRKNSAGELREMGLARMLQAARLPFVPHDNCAESMKVTKYTVTENMICAGGNGSDACGGDSGGPLTCARNGTTGLEEERYLCGIVSWGITCSRKRNPLPGVYTDVTRYTGWIRKFMRTWWKHYWMTKLAAPRIGQSGCGAGKYQCPNNGLCIPETFKCDGENDCDPLDSDSDESQCHNVTIMCPESKFKCNSTQTCIPSNYKCDGDDDCGDGSDEQGCEQY